jgi:hypothetical protein
MEEWLRTFKPKMKQQQHNVISFLSIRPSILAPHSYMHSLQSFPQHHSISQSMGQGVIKCVKLNCCMLFGHSLVASTKAASFSTQPAKSISIKSGWLREKSKCFCKQ